MQEVELAPHQVKAVARLHNGSILSGAVGVGKSRAALRYYTEKESPRDVYVITTARKRDEVDWEVEAYLHGIGTEADATFHGVLKVDSWNNIEKYVDVENAFFIFDEQRVVGSGAWVKHFYKIAKKNHWILLSATPGDTWLDYIPVFIANGFYKNRTEFMRQHVVFNRFSKFPKVDRYIAVGRLVRNRNNLLVDMPYERHTKRVFKDVPVDYDVELFKKVVDQRWHPYENRPIRDVSELFMVMRKVVNSDASRLEAVRSLTIRHPKLIVFYTFDYELEILRKLASDQETEEIDQCESITSSTREHSPRSNSTSSTASRASHQEFESPSTDRVDRSQSGPTSRIQIAEWNGHKHEPIPTSDSWIYLVQYQSGAESWNCVETNAMAFYSLNYSYRLFSQAQGRIDRLNTPYTDLYYYVLKSESMIDKAIWRALKAKKSFNENALRRAFPDLD